MLPTYPAPARTVGGRRLGVAPLAPAWEWVSGTPRGRPLVAPVGRAGCMGDLGRLGAPELRPQLGYCSPVPTGQRLTVNKRPMFSLALDLRNCIASSACGPPTQHWSPGVPWSLQ